MKLMLALIFASSMMAPGAYAYNLSCGIKPIPPIGCKSENAHCVCTADGECHWEFDC